MSISPAATKRANMPRSTPSNPVAPRRSPKEDGGRSSVRSGDNASGLSVCDVDGDRTGANRPVAAAVGATALCPRERVDSDGTNCSVGCGITLRSLWLSFLTFLGRPFVRCSFVKSCARKVVQLPNAVAVLRRMQSAIKLKPVERFHVPACPEPPQRKRSVLRWRTKEAAKYAARGDMRCKGRTISCGLLRGPCTPKT